ncbi:TlpA family protein disulfide reductase [Aquabacterium sp. A7-Y]|uniref:TlpA disulfide reductase family protein n=1 Tax=Aquabacterium sp. A7-Y TaxID=1349605 RepID=UPI00223D3885|nr:TlpA disulfide reductase family protein [Aquabacterium sp. A7-Y]MCW7538588.1 TlpA family protein disulfide reductase [Aquabacterium sp. A7-Y]
MQHPGFRTLGRVLTLTLALCTALPATAAGPQSAAPDFTLRSLQGQNLRLQEQRGRVVMINFWATWCGPCREEMPHLNRLYEKYRGSGFTVLAVNVDEDGRNAASMATKLGLKFPVLFDSDKTVSRLYDLKAMPSTLILDRDGRVRFLHRGYLSGYENTYDQQIRDLLKE